MRHGIIGWLAAAALAAVAAADLHAAEEKNDEAKNLDIVKNLLKDKHPGDQWQRGPARMQNAALDKAYPDAKFYYVFSPRLPVARAREICAMVRVDKDGSAAEVSASAPGTFNAGLMRVRNSSEAQTAAAAIMSLTFGPFGPMPVSVADVRVAREGQGWLCLATLGDGRGPRKPHVFEVRFDGDGQCRAVTHRYIGLLPTWLEGQSLAKTIGRAVSLHGLSNALQGQLSNS